MTTSACLLLLAVCSSMFEPLAGHSTAVLERTVARWSQHLYQSISSLREVIGTEQLNKMYKNSSFGVQEMTDSYARGLLDEAIVELTQIIRKKEKALEKLRDNIEEEYKKQDPLEYDECYIRAKAVSLFPYPTDENGTNAVPCNESQYLPMEADSMFGHYYVSRNISAAHIPTNVYDLSKEIRTVGNWTHHLDDVFKENIQQDPLLKWQYFCSSTGYFKFYPGAMWKVQLVDLKLDFFDCRSTAWYVGAASYPIEMIILADKSGSMKGRRNTICNATISELLNTLTDDDFFNVIYFSESIKFAEEYVTDRLIQATTPNKDRIVRGFADHMPNGTSNFRAALTAAFSLLNISRNGTGINRCNKMIMLITDGIPDSFEDLFKEYNPEKSVRVFTFLIGQHSADENIVRKITCANRGMDANIANLADVKENVLKYLDIVARSNAVLDDSFVRWSGVTELQINLMELTPENFTRPPEDALNATLPENRTVVEEGIQEDSPEASEETPPLVKFHKPKNSQFFITLSRAAYDKTNATVENNLGILLGVTGLDIPMEDLEDVLRSWKTGPLSYFFGLNNNGFVLFHPNYRPLHGTQLKRYYRNVDIDELEQSLGSTLNPHTALPVYNSTLRKLLIDRATASTVETTLETPEDFLSGLPLTKKIYTAPLPETPFVFGLAVRWMPNTNRGVPIPKYDTGGFWRQGGVRAADTRVLNPQFMDPARSCDVDETLPYGAKLAPVRFCKFRRQLLDVFIDQPLCALRNVAIDKQLREENECDLDHIARIALDSRATTKIYDYWRRMGSHQTTRRFGIQQVFSLHQSGLLRYYNFSQPTYNEFLDEINMGSESALYKSAVLHSTFYENMKMLVFRPPPKQIFRNFLEENVSVPMAVVSVISNPASEAVPMGIAGAQINYRKFQEEFFDLVNTCSEAGCLKCNDSGVQCFLTTTAGQIILSTAGEKAVSQNVKEIDCALMEALVDAGIIREQEVYDFHAICIDAVTPDMNFGSRLFSPIAFLFTLIGRAMKEFITAVSTWWLLGSSAAGQGAWDSLPPLSTSKTTPESSPFGFHDGADQFVYPHHGEVDFSLPGGAPSIDDPFYRDYEVLKPFESPHIPPTPPPTSTPPQTSAAPPTCDQTDQTLPDLPLFFETAQFYSQKNYIFEDPDDPWLMQQQAFAELDMCYANEPTLNPPPPPPVSTIAINASTNATLEVIDITKAMTTGEPIQLLSGNITLVNATIARNTTEPQTSPRKINTVPGTLLRCVQRIVQMRCHAAVHSNSQIGRQACEVMCDAVRQRMPKLTEFLHDCRQALDSCTQRHSIFYLNKEAHAGSVRQPLYGYGDSSVSGRQAKLHSGTYCPSCGSVDWTVSSIPNTNLLLIMTARQRGKPTINCICECRRRYRYGAQLKSDKSIPRTRTYRRDPVTPRKCEMIPYKLENFTSCLSGTQSHAPGPALWLVAMASAVLRLV